MSLIFAPGWELTNSSTPNMSEDAIRTKTISALTNLATIDTELTYLKTIAASGDPLWKAKVTKGLHQEEGSGILPDSHVQLEIADFPYPKRFHLYFWYVKKGKKTDWYAYKLTHIDHANGKARVSANIEGT